jgi:hypothetical protein
MSFGIFAGIGFHGVVNHYRQHEREQFESPVGVFQKFHFLSPLISRSWNFESSGLPRLTAGIALVIHLKSDCSLCSPV